jgi:putative Mg2+ transporter-C (MgtC) family protein
LRYGASIRGLTTATSLWTLAIVGLAVGDGQYLVGVATTVFLLMILSLLDLVEKYVVRARVQTPLMVSGKADQLQLETLRALLKAHKMGMTNLFVSRNIKKQTVTLRVMVIYSGRTPVQPLLDDLSAMPGVHTFQLGEPAAQI